MHTNGRTTDHLLLFLYNLCNCLFTKCLIEYFIGMYGICKIITKPITSHYILNKCSFNTHYAYRFLNSIPVIQSHGVMSASLAMRKIS